MPGAYTLKAGLYSENQKISLPHLNAAGAFAGERAKLGEIQLPGHQSVSESNFRAFNGIAGPADNADLNQNLALLGSARLPASIRQGERLPLTLFWYARTATKPITLSVTLGGRTLLAARALPGWASGLAVMQHEILRVPFDLPPGKVDLRVTAEPYGAAHLATLDVAGVERIYAQPQVERLLRANYQDLLALTGYALAPGPTTRLSLTWQGRAPNDMDYTVFVHILDAGGQIVAQTDQQPQAGAYPTSLWAPGEYVTDAYTFNLPPGAYTAEIGLYLAETGERLTVTGMDTASPNDKVLLPGFDVK
jgi:hypothetical protein